MPRYTLSDPSLVSFGCEYGSFVRDEDGTFELPSEAIAILLDINVVPKLVAEPETPAPEPAHEGEGDHVAHRRGKPKHLA